MEPQRLGLSMNNPPYFDGNTHPYWKASMILFENTTEIGLEFNGNIRIEVAIKIRWNW